MITFRILSTEWSGYFVTCQRPHWKSRTWSLESHLDCDPDRTLQHGHETKRKEKSECSARPGATANAPTKLPLRSKESIRLGLGLVRFILFCFVFVLSGGCVNAVRTGLETVRLPMTLISEESKESKKSRQMPDNTRHCVVCTHGDGTALLWRQSGKSSN